MNRYFQEEDRLLDQKKAESNALPQERKENADAR